MPKQGESPRNRKPCWVIASDKASTVNPPIFPTSKTSIPLVVPVLVEPQYLTYGKSLCKFYTSYGFQFQDIRRILIPANTYPRNNNMKIGLKKKVHRKDGSQKRKTPFGWKSEGVSRRIQKYKNFTIENSLKLFLPWHALYSVLCKLYPCTTQIFLFSSPSWDITKFNWLCLSAPCAKTPLQSPSSPYFQSSATPYLLELSEVSLYPGKYSVDVTIRQYSTTILIEGQTA